MQVKETFSMGDKKTAADLLKELYEHVDNIHDNYGTIQSIERQKKTADASVVGSLDGQIQEIMRILENNKKKVLDHFETIFSSIDPEDEKLKKDLEKLKQDFENHSTDPDLLVIQKDIEQIKKDLK